MLDELTTPQSEGLPGCKSTVTGGLKPEVAQPPGMGPDKLFCRTSSCCRLARAEAQDAGSVPVSRLLARVKFCSAGSCHAPGSELSNLLLLRSRLASALMDQSTGRLPERPSPGSELEGGQGRKV